MNLQGLADRIERLAEKLDNRFASLVDYTTIAKTSADGSRDESSATADQNERQRAQRPFLRTAPWGIAGRPMLEGVFVALVRAFGGAFSGMQVGIWTDRYGPQNLEEGETCLYCKATGTRVWLDKNGVIHIDAAAGQDIVFNGGSLQVARKTDPVIAGPTMTTWISKVNAVAAAIDPTIVAPTDFGRINGGAPNVKS